MVDFGRVAGDAVGTARGGVRAGFTLVEVVIGFVLVVVALLGFSNSIVNSMLAADRDAEMRLATEAARAAVERIRGADFALVFRLYNSDPGDDPGGPGTAPGADFDVARLDARAGDPDGMVGQVILPESFDIGGNAILREDLAVPALGLPRDLSGDGLTDADDHALDYAILPVVVRVEWEGAGGAAIQEFQCLLGEL